MKKIFQLLLLGLIFLPQALFAEKYALIFASNYKGSPINDLELAERDARLMKKQILKTDGFTENNVRMLLAEKLTRANLKKNIVHWLAKEVKAGDQVFFYFAGHGMFLRDRKAVNGMRNTIVMHTRPHVTDEELNEWFNKVTSKKAVIIFDACFSGGIAKKGIKVRGNGNIPIPAGSDSIVLQDLNDVYFKDKVVISSADDNETAIEMSAPISHGVFTYYFSKAMLEADLNNDNNVTAYEAFYKARNQTISLAKRAKHKQHPQISGNASGYFFVKNSQPIVTVTEVLPPNTALINEQEPAIDETEPLVFLQSKKGSLVISTNYRKRILRRNRPKVFIDKDETNANIRWVNDITWGQVAEIHLDSILSGVHNVTIKTAGYGDRVIKTGIEAGQTTYENLLAARNNKGAISGHVWVENFSTPFKNLQIFLRPIANVRKPRVRSKSDGSFSFENIKPGKYNIFVVGGLGYFTKPYNKDILIEANKVAKIEIVLKESLRKKKIKK